MLYRKLGTNPSRVLNVIQFEIVLLYLITDLLGIEAITLINRLQDSVHSLKENPSKIPIIIR